MNYAESIQKLWDESKVYLELQKRYLKLDTAEKLTVLLSVTATAVLCLTLGAMALFFLLLALANWFGHLIGNQTLGYLCMGVLLLLTMGICYAGRKRWIVQPLARLIAGLFVGEEHDAQERKEDVAL